MMVALLVA